MRRIDRYISREVFSHATLGLLIFTFVLFIPQLVRLMELLVRHGGGASAGTVGMLVLCAMPQVLTFTAPMAVLVGVIIGLGRMSADSEIIALHALGISLRRILLSVGVVALGGAALTLAMTMWLGPLAAREFRDIEQRLRTTQASFEVQPRVFDERFPGVVLYIQDVEAAGTRWRGLLLAESNPRSRADSSGARAAGKSVKRVTLAEEAVVIADRRQGRLQLHLRNGSTHEYSADDPERYAVSTFGHSDLPITVTAPDAPGTSGRARQRTLAERGAAELWSATQSGAEADARHAAAVELHRRIALPLACVVFALAGVPMGARPRRGGRAAGFVLTLLLICGYYFLFVTGAGLAQRGSLAPWAGLWAANLITAAAALILLPRVEQTHHEGLFTRWVEALAPILSGLAPIFSRLAPILSGLAPILSGLRIRGHAKAASHTSSNGSGAQPHARSDGAQAAIRPAAAPSRAGSPRVSRLGTALGFPLLMDFYLLRGFFGMLALVLAGFILLFQAFTFFDLLDDIAGNNIAVSTVAQYFIFLTPHLMYQILPLAALVAALGTLGVLTRNNEITAFKAGGTSLYRLAAPLLIGSALLAIGMFAMDSTFLPYSNQRQDALRNIIKRRPAQTFYQPRGQWIFGSSNAGFQPVVSAPPSSSLSAHHSPALGPVQGSLRLFNYQYFDPDLNRFAGLNVLHLDPRTFQLQRIVYAARARWSPSLSTWVLEEGWLRNLANPAFQPLVSPSSTSPPAAPGQPQPSPAFLPFSVLSLPELSDSPDYFKREVLPAYQMSWSALAACIADLQRAGFDVARLRTHFYRKFAFPLLAPVIVLLAIPFGLSLAPRGRPFASRSAAPTGIANALLIAISCWALSALFEALGSTGRLPPALAAWSPTAIFALLASYFFLKMET